jgi:hypothetical protein
MPITATPGFFGKPSRQRKPAGVDVVFTTDFSGSMGNLISFINQTSTILSLEDALIAENVGLLIPNRYSKSSMQNQFRSATPRSLYWELGQDIINDPTIWNNWANSGRRWGASQEDVTGSVFRIANTGFPYNYDTTNNPVTNGSPFSSDDPLLALRNDATTIVIAGSDEQTSATQYHTDLVYSQITSPAANLRYVALSSVRIEVTIPQELLNKVAVFGVVFTSPTIWKVIYRPLLDVPEPLPPGTPIFADFSSTTVNFFDNIDQPINDTSASGPIIINPSTSSGFVQCVNTPKLARGTAGAIYDIDQFNQPNGPEVFGKSLGLVLGRFLYELE